jgi:hypothetical protein
MKRKVFYLAGVVGLSLSPSFSQTRVYYDPIAAELASAPSGSGANASGYYLVSRSTSAPTNAVNLGALTTGPLYITVSGSVATPSTSKVALTQPATGSTLTIADGKTLTASNTITLTGTDGVSANVSNMRLRPIGMFFDGGGVALANNQVKYFTWLGGACTVAGWAITVDTGTITFDIWKKATGTAIPTVSDTIVASAAPAIASGTALKSTTMTGWTTSVADGDIFGFKITAISSATQSSIILQCAQ